MPRWYYSSSITDFINSSSDEVLGQIGRNHEFTLLSTQKDAWIEQIVLLKKVLGGFSGRIYFEYHIPRMGKRIDVLLLIGPVIIVIEFKVGESDFTSAAIDQVWDYALDLKNFHEPSHSRNIVPILVATDAEVSYVNIPINTGYDGIFYPIKCNVAQLKTVLEGIANVSEGDLINPISWENGRYCPTPTIIEAALALYQGHSVAEISRNDASSINLSITSESISKIIRHSRDHSKKSICFVTGVPGAGKTLVGLNIATTHIDKNSDLYSVFLSGNGPLVAILREALARDKVEREKGRNNRFKIGKARSEVKAFIQPVHHFRDEGIEFPERAPLEHVTLFDEAQRAWTLEKTSDFMKRRRGVTNFNQSEPDFLISCLDRHKDWAVIVCLVGGGQEIHLGEAGISEWISALEKSYHHWDVYISNKLSDSEYSAEETLNVLSKRPNVTYKPELHLATSMRSFRAENVSSLIKSILDLNIPDATYHLEKLKEKYPIVITRDLDGAKRWLRSKSRGTERYGIVVSSQAERLKPYAIDVKTPMDPIHWFLDPKEDIRSSYYLEDIATEFSIQGLELDWVCVTWDADFRYTDKGWEHWSFQGDKWKRVNKSYRKQYQKNAYRVLLTRARQGMVIVVPRGEDSDPTRLPDFYDNTFNYLKSIGFQQITGPNY